MSSNAIQHSIFFCVALQCVIKRRIFQGNHVLYHRGTVASHLQSGRLSPVGNRVWWVLDWVWRVRSFAHISHHCQPLQPPPCTLPFTPTSRGWGERPSATHVCSAHFHFTCLFAVFIEHLWGIAALTRICTNKISNWFLFFFVLASYSQCKGRGGVGVQSCLR